MSQAEEVIVVPITLKKEYYDVLVQVASMLGLDIQTLIKNGVCAYLQIAGYHIDFLDCTGMNMDINMEVEVVEA